MAIEINPRRINLPSGRTGERPRPLADTSAFITPVRAAVNHIPSPESLQTLIRSGLEALRRGMRWDRGTILNLLV